MKSLPAFSPSDCIYSFFFISLIRLYFLLLSVHPLVRVTIFLDFVTSTSIFLSFSPSAHLSIFFHAHIHTHDSSPHAQYLHTWILPHTFSPLSCLLQTVATHTWSKNPLPINKGRVIKSLSITTTISTTYHYHFIDCPKSQLSALLAEVNSGPRHGYHSDRHITVSGSPSHDGQRCRRVTAHSRRYGTCGRWLYEYSYSHRKRFSCSCFVMAVCPSPRFAQTSLCRGLVFRTPATRSPHAQSRPTCAVHDGIARWTSPTRGYLTPSRDGGGDRGLGIVPIHVHVMVIVQGGCTWLMVHRRQDFTIQHPSEQSMSISEKNKMSVYQQYQKLKIYH